MGPMAAAGPQAPAPNCPPSGPFINVLFLNWWVMACHKFHWVLDRALSLTNPIFKQSLPCSFPSSFAYSDLCFPQEYLEGGAFQSTVTFGFALTCFFWSLLQWISCMNLLPCVKKGSWIVGQWFFMKGHTLGQCLSVIDAATSLLWGEHRFPSTCFLMTSVWS